MSTLANKRSFFYPYTTKHVCGVAIFGLFGGKYDDEFRGLACLRYAEHEGEHIAAACDAAEADGVRFCCHVPSGEAHRDDCYSLIPVSLVEEP